jgi:hypothetical protein
LPNGFHTVFAQDEGPICQAEIKNFRFWPCSEHRLLPVLKRKAKRLLHRNHALTEKGLAPCLLTFGNNTRTMVRDKVMRLLFIPLLGLAIPFFSGAVTYSSYSGAALAAVHLYFLFVSFSIWQGCHWIHGKLRRHYPVKSSPYTKMIAICLLSGIYGACIAGLLFLVWTKLSREAFSGTTLLQFMALSTFAIMLFTLLYEVLYLSKERQQDSHRADELDREKTLAEMQALRNELDPHFLFNSLTSLSYLIRLDPEKALLFDEKLAQVFHYFLRHKNQDLIALEKELLFLDDYFFLLQIRHDEKLQLQIRDRHLASGYVVPCSLQLLLENAIKHNAFSAAQPLCIRMEAGPQAIWVTNNLQPKKNSLPSTGIGLANLNQRYRILCQQEIAVEKTAAEFRVCLPVVTQPAPPIYRKGIQAANLSCFIMALLPEVM